MGPKPKILQPDGNVFLRSDQADSYEVRIAGYGRIEPRCPDPIVHGCPPSGTNINGKKVYYRKNCPHIDCVAPHIMES